MTLVHAPQSLNLAVSRRPRKAFAHALAVALTVVAAAMLAPPAAALTIDAASVAFNPKKSDAFAVKGRLAGLVIADIDTVQVEFGDFSQTIPIASFTEKKGKLSFKAAKGVPGIATFTIDTVKGKFAAAAKGLTLSPFANPAPFHLVADGLDECSTLSFTESRNKRKLASVVPACGFDGVPRVSPSAFFVGTPTEVRVRVTVLDDLALDLGSLVLLRLDEALQAIGAPLCTLHDDGLAAHGDDVAVDGIFSCHVTLSEPQPARLRLAVRASRGGVLVLSPSAFVHAVDMISDAEIMTVIDGQEAAGAIWDDAFATLGDTKNARKQAVAGILALPGVANAGVTGDGASIFIEYESGVHGGLDLDPVSVDVPPAATVSILQSRARSSAAGASVPAALPAIAAGANDGPQVGNSKVLIWSAFYKEPLMAEGTDAFEALFKAAPCPHFDVTVLKDEECTLASLATFPDYGTIVIATHGAQPHRGGDVAIMSGQKATTFSEYVTYRSELSLGSLLVYNGGRSPAKLGHFVVFPAFLEESLKGTGKRFPNTIVFSAACTGAANKTMATPFLSNGAQAYLGMSDKTHARFDNYTVPLFFGNLINNVSSVATAFAAIPNKTVAKYFRNVVGIDPKQLPFIDSETFGSELTLVQGGDSRVTYPCEPPPPGLVDTINVSVGPNAHAVGQVKLQTNLHYRLEVTGMTHRQLDPDFSDFDALYCFNGSSPGACSPPFPESNQLQFYSQVGDETPGFSSLKDAADFTHSAFPAFDGGHKYTFHFNGTGGKVWVQTWPFLNPAPGETLTGSFAVRVFLE